MSVTETFKGDLGREVLSRRVEENVWKVTGSGPYFLTRPLVHSMTPPFTPLSYSVYYSFLDYVREIRVLKSQNGNRTGQYSYVSYVSKDTDVKITLSVLYFSGPDPQSSGDKVETEPSLIRTSSRPMC